MKDNEFKLESIKELSDKHNHCLDLVRNPELPRSISEQREILKLQLKGLEYIEKNSNTDLLLNNSNFEYNNELKLKLVEIGSLVEKQEYLIEKNLDIESRVDNQLKLELITEELENNLGLTNKNKLNNLPKPEPIFEKEKEQINENELNYKPEDSNKIKVNLNEELITQELIEKAKLDGDLKETKLNSTKPTDNGQIGASLVVNLDEQKIANTIQSLEDKLNPVNKENNINTVDNSEKPKEKNKNKVESKNRLPKPQPSNPSPENKKEIKVEQPKPYINLNTKIAELSAKFREQQENNPFVLDQEKFDTVLKPQVPLYQDKNLVSKNIFAMRERSISGATPDIVENNYGVEERKSTRRLKA